MAASVGFDLLDVAEELEESTRELPQGVWSSLKLALISGGFFFFFWGATMVVGQIVKKRETAIDREAERLMAKDLREAGMFKMLHPRITASLESLIAYRNSAENVGSDQYTDVAVQLDALGLWLRSVGIDVPRILPTSDKNIFDWTVALRYLSVYSEMGDIISARRLKRGIPPDATIEAVNPDRFKQVE